jgi:hypothetical protein
MSALGGKANIARTLRQLDSVRVVRSDIAGDLGAFFHIAVDDGVGHRRATVIGLFKTAIAAIEAREQLFAAVSLRRFGIDQGPRLAPPFLALAAVADAAQEMQRPHLAKTVTLIEVNCEVAGQSYF